MTRAVLSLPRRNADPRPRLRAALLGAVVVANGVMSLTADPAGADVGVVGPSYEPASAPTAEKPQSKLWFAQSSWWGLLFSAASGDHTIHRLDDRTGAWVDSGVFVDNRNASHSDALWDGKSLWVASAVRPGASASDHRALLRRYSYDTGTRAYRIDAGFPVTLADVATEAVVLDKDTSGTVWVTWTAPTSGGGRQVYVTRTMGTGASVVAPFALPVTGAATLTSDDISAVVAFRSHIGVMWSNQNDDIMYFATHRDGDPDGAWAVDPAIQGPRYADDHMNLKSLQADAAGDVFAAVKTEQTTSGAPLILLAVLRQGSWTRHTFATVEDDHTRPLVLIDRESRELYLFAVSPCCSGGTVYVKKTLLDNISFAPGLGTPFIQSATNGNVNNPTSTKQTLDSTTGLVVLAGDDRTHRYLHNSVELAGKVDTAIDSGPSGVVASRSATFAFSSVPSGATFECALDAAPFASCTSPAEYSGLVDGPHTFRVRAVAPDGTVDPTPATRPWTVDVVAPEVVDRSPVDGQSAVDQGASVTATFSEAMDGATLSTDTFTLVRDGTDTPLAATVSRDATTSTAVLDPQAPLELAAGYTATVRGGSGGVRDSAGTPMAADVIWRFTTVTADTRPPQTLLTDSGPAGTVDTSSALFTFSADEPGSTFECQLDGSTFTGCTSPVSHTGLADGPHVFAVRATDGAGNVDPTPATRSWAVAATLLADGFESGDFTQWSAVHTGGDGTAAVQGEFVGTGGFAARLSATTAANSYAFLRTELADAHTELTVTAAVHVLGEEVAKRDIPLLAVSGSEGTLVTLVRESATGELRVRYGGAVHPTAARLEASSWHGVAIRMVAGGSGGGTVEVRLDGAIVHRSTTATVGTAGARRVQVGSDHRRQPFDIAFDDVSLRA